MDDSGGEIGFAVHLAVGTSVVVVMSPANRKSLDVAAILTREPMEQESTSPFGVGHSPYEGSVEKRAAAIALPTDEAPRPEEVLSPEVMATLTDLRNNVVVTCVEYVRLVSDDAIRITFNHFVNDVHALVEEIAILDGRGAARTARAIFEDAVAVARLHQDRTLSSKYLEHGAFDTLHLQRNGLGIGRLEKPDRSTAQRRLARMVKGASKVAGASTTPQVAKKWDLSKYEQAKLLGWADRYEDGYRLLSSVAHGSGAGVLGSRKGNGANATFRWGGPSLEWLPVALLESLTNIELLLDYLDANVKDFDAQELQTNLDACFDAWPEFRAAVHDADKRFWPHDPVQPDTCGALIFPGAIRWIVVDGLYGVVSLADEPSPDQVTQALRDFLDEKQRKLRKAGVPSTEQRGVSVMIEGLKLRPKAGAKWHPSESVLIPPDHPGYPRFENPEVTRLGSRKRRN